MATDVGSIGGGVVSEEGRDGGMSCGEGRDELSCNWECALQLARCASGSCTVCSVSLYASAMPFVRMHKCTLFWFFGPLHGTIADGLRPHHFMGPWP